MTGEHVRRSTRGGVAGFRVGGEITVLAIGIAFVVLGWRRGEPFFATGLACAVAAAASIVVRAWSARRRAVRSGGVRADAPAAGAVLLRERTRTAGELSDVLGRLSLISMYASKLELDPARIGRGDDEVQAIRRTAALALDELRTTVNQLGGVDPAAGTAAPVAAPQDVLELVDRSRAAGFPVQLTWLGGADAGVDPVADREVRRVVEEALDGAVRQAPGSTAAITVRQSADQVRVVVLNGTGATADRRPGDEVELLDVRDRIEALGGRLSTEESLDGTFRITAVVPRHAPGRRPGPRAARVRRVAAVVAVPLVVMLLAGGTWYAFERSRPGASPAPVGDSSSAPGVGGASPAPTGRPEVEVNVRFTGETPFVGEDDGDGCIRHLGFEARIRVSHGPVTVRYAWTRSDDSVGRQETVDFPGSGPQERVVSDYWAQGQAGSGWQAMQLITPVAVSSNRAAFTLEC